jgi:pimeloyl-ACP methyl ester carboxylesterase
MKFEICGNVDAAKKGMLLHSLCLDAAQFDGVRRRLEREYCLIIPAFDGHYADNQTGFTSLDDQVDQILAYLDARGLTGLDFIAGVSLGALAAFELYKRKRLKVRTYFFDGGPFFRITSIGKKVMAVFFGSLMFLSRRMPRCSARVAAGRYGFELAAVIARISRIIRFRDIANMMNTGFDLEIPAPLYDGSSRLVFVYGSRENAYRSFRRFRDEPGIELIVKDGFAHCQYLAKRPAEYADLLRTGVADWNQ